MVRREQQRDEVMRGRRVRFGLAAVALTGVLATGCAHAHAPSGASSSGTERQMEQKVSDAESAAAAADADAQSDQ
ncbi:hypothetical protein ACGFW5_32510 [Streptomyces sp. NPDC048416]|uniref:hypothetical protein n=1 Tax=Streptomyces sp. NPDC048416 TaxID=3365546 RepID=UPI0037246E7A